MTVEKLFNTLWNKYISLAPQAHTINTLFQNTQKTKIVNDHIALRTLSYDSCNIDVLASVFIKLGYVKKDYYYFKNKNLSAYYFSHENKTYPKAFISQLEVKKFSIDVQNILSSIIKQVPNSILQSDTLTSSQRHWDVSYKTYKMLYEKSEYAAWFYVFGFTANHFTILINQLEQFDNIIDVNNFLKDNSYVLNNINGEIKGSAKQYLEQSSTIAQSVEIEFEEGVYSIPSCFYEFAQRYENKQGQLYDGFIEKSADLIFQSTDNS